MNQLIGNESVIQFKIFRVILYIVLLLVINVSIFYGLSVNYDVHNQLDLILVGIYSILALLSYYFFVINDINARKLKGRAMAIGFFICYLAISIVASSFIFDLPQKFAWYIAGILLITGYLLGAFGVTRWAKYNKQVKKDMLIENHTDALTGLFNRRAFADKASKELEFSVSSESDFSVLIIDIDDFKLVNDQYGHAVGDEVLKQMSQLIQKYTRHSDSIYRWGGEEFVILMPITGLFGANKVAHKIKNMIADHSFNINDELSLNLTVSIGLAQWVHGESIINDTLIRADKALYKAKASGKNAVIAANYKDETSRKEDKEESQQSKQFSGN